MSKNAEVLLQTKEGLELFAPDSISRGSSEARQRHVGINSAGCAGEVELVQRVFLLPAQEVPHVVVFCGVDSIDGASGICARVAQNLAHLTGSSVSVVEGDFRYPSLHQEFGIDNSRGFTDALFDSGPIKDFAYPIPGSGLSVLPAGSHCKDVKALWKSEGLRNRMEELRREFSYVVVYGPQLTQFYDAAVLGRMADGVILILESMATRREATRIAKENLVAANVKILGAVLNNHTFSIPETLYKKV